MSGTVKPWVTVVGAGPAGLLLALLLSQKGVPVLVLDTAKELDNRPRATHYGPPAMYELERAGVAEQVRNEGFLPTAVCWRKLTGPPLAFLDSTLLSKDPNQMACLPLNSLGKILLARLLLQPNAEVKWSHKVVAIGQDDKKAWVEVETPNGSQKLESNYIVGCDGANSQIRRSLFGDWNFPGKTWDEQIVATNTYYPFEKFGWLDSNFIIDPEHWFMAAKIGTDGLWRVTYGEQSGLSHDELAARQPGKFEAMLPGHPKPHEYRMVNFSPYKVHQRVAESMRVGRFLLAADAAHLCNPFGGMGLTGGIVDVGGLFDCLVGLFEGRADASILDKYSDIRREKYTAIVDPVSTSNLLRLLQDPDTALEKDEFLQLCKKAEADDEFSAKLQGGVMALQHDFTQYYHDGSVHGKQDVADEGVMVNSPTVASLSATSVNG